MADVIEFTKTTFKDEPSEETPIDATSLNNIGDTLEKVVEKVNEHTENLEDLSNGVDKEAVKEAVNEYLEENPPSSESGEDGATYIPSVDEEGNLSWTNDKGLLNPETVNIKGPQGEKGDTGDTGPSGSNGQDGSDGADGVGIASVVQTTTSSADGGNNIITVTLTNQQTATFTVKNGSKGSNGNDGVDGKDGSDASVTSENIKSALGYTPANEDTVTQLSEQKVDQTQITQSAGESASLLMSQKAVTQLVADALGDDTEEYETVDSISEMTDTSKSYVLSTDGYIYTYTEKKEIVQHEAENKFVASEATVNQRMGSSSLSAQNGFVWTGAIPVDLTKESPFRVKVEGTLITEDTSTYQKIWLCADDTGTTKLSAAVLLVGNTSSNYATLLEDGTIYADYKAGAKLDDSIITGTKYLRIGFKFSDSAIGSTSELSGVKITFPCEAYTEEVTTYEWQNTGLKPNGTTGGNYLSLYVKVNKNTQDIEYLENRVNAIDSGTSNNNVIVPSFWESAVDACVSKIKALQVGRDCVTFAFFSDNHQNTQYVGSLIRKVMQECYIPYCFFGGDAIDSGTLADEDAMIANDKAFDDAMSIVPVEQMCRAVGNHDGYWLDNDGVKNRYTRSQIYDLFLRQESVAQNKHYGGDGTFYYVDDLASDTMFIVCNTNYNVNTATDTLDSVQLAWLEDVVFAEANKSMKLVFISHQPITNNHHSNIYADTAHAIQELLTTKIEDGWNVVGWFSGHIHADRIYQTDHTTNVDANDQTTVSLPWKTVTIRADHTGLCRDEDLIHTPADDNQSHAIDFVTINKVTRTVNLTRLGIGSDRSYTY